MNASKRTDNKKRLYLSILLSLVVLSLNVSDIFADVIVDNGDNNTSYTGTWSVSSGTLAYGADSLWARDGATYTWGFDSQPSGNYEVLMWWSQWPSRSTNVTVTINHYSGYETVTINQYENAGQWNSLGMYDFGTSGSLTITASYGSTVSTCADAVWFRLVSQNSPPSAYIDSISPNPADEGQTVQFSGHGEDGDGSIVTYQWTSSLDGVLSNAQQFSTQSLLPGSHQISFQVQDNDGLWSQPAESVLTVGSVSDEIIIDNRDSATSQTGTWQVSSGSYPYGADSVWSRDGVTFTWHFTPPQIAEYNVWMWWTEWPSRSSNAAVDIKHADGTSAVYVNQKQNAGQWNLLGSYIFDPAQEGTVTIYAEDPYPVSYCADAVRFGLATSNIAPTAVIDTISPNPADLGQTVSFSGRGQDPDGNITAYNWSSSIDGILSNESSFSTSALTAGDHVITFTVYDNDNAASQPVSRNLSVGQAVVERIIDNGDPETSYTGTWSVSGGADPYGADSYWSRDGSTYTWTFTPTVSGYYQVYMCWTQWSSRSTSVPVDIEDAGSTTRVYVNQQENSSQWNSLGQYSFQAGSSYTVTVTAQPYPASTCADAVRFVHQGAANTPPVATIDSITPNLAHLGEMVTFVGHGQDPDGSITAYNWSSSIDGSLSNNSTFSTSNLSLSDHIITFIVYDNDSTASEPVTQVLSIREVISEDIIDNGSAVTSYTGTWSVSGAAEPYGTDSYWSRDGSTYTWTFSPTLTGYYQVYMWWTQWPSRSDNVPVDIENVSSTARVYINQQANGGQWNSLGQYAFSSGSSYDVTVTAQPDPTSTCADAVRFVYQTGGNMPPAATIDSITPNPASPGQTVTFVGYGTDSDGTVESYNWRSNIDGSLRTSSTFSTSSLSTGTHTIYFSVQDNQGIWSSEVTATLSIGIENIYVAFIYNWENLEPQYVSMLQSIGAWQQADVWTYTNTNLNRTYRIRFVKDIGTLKQALTTEGAHVILAGHANYGLGPSFATSTELARQVIEDIRYIDDDRILNFSTPWIHVNIHGMRTGQAYPYWWPIFKDGTSGIMPYDFNDPRGDPPYNYYLTYQPPGTNTYYKIEPVHNSAVERFPDSGKPAWYSALGQEPDPQNPDHLKYYITNTTPWSASFETVGNWVQYQLYQTDDVEYFKENYIYNTVGSGNDRATWLFTIPAAENYKVLAWWPSSQSHATNAPYIVNHASGSTTVRKNQRINGRQWNDIGQFYFNQGDYSVVLTDDGDYGSVAADAVRIAHADNPPEVVQADFYASERSGPAPLTVDFDNQSTGDFTSRLWNFGDGYTNTTRDHIDHTYMLPGTYTVSLGISGPAGSSSKTKQGYVTVGYGSEVLQAEFSGNEVGEIPLDVRFRDRSSGDLREGITYTPPSGFTGTETFTYVVKNTEGATSNQATVTVTVGNVPVAANDTAITATDTPVTVDVLANDVDADGFLEPNTVIVTSGPDNGTAVVNGGDGTITYSPQGAFSGIDMFTYTVEDDSGAGSNEAVVTVTVSDGPVAINDTAVTTEGTPVIIDVLGNDTHSDGVIEPTTVIITTEPNNGTAEANDIDGTITYSPELSFAGMDMFAYTVADSNGAVSNEAEVTVTVGNSPVAVDDSAVTAEDTPVTIDVLDNDVDAEGQIDPGTITIINSPANGSAVAHDCWLWNFGDGSTSHEQRPRHTYSQPGNYTVSLTVTDVSGSSVTETKPNFIRALIYEKTIDNVDYPKTHYRSKTILFRKEMEIDKEQLRYTRMLYDSCNTGNYYLGTFNRGIMFYTLANSGSRGSVLYLRAYVEGKSDEQIWQIIQDFEPSYDYYNFNQAPPALQTQTVSVLASDNGVKPAVPALTDTNEPDKQEKIEQLKMLSVKDAFERLKDSDFLTDKALLKQGISTAFKNVPTQAVTLSLEKLKGPVKQVSQDKVIHRAGDIYIAKKILAAFPLQSVDALLQLYESSDTITKANVLLAAGALAGNEDIDNMLIEALDDKSSCEDQNTEIMGQALRICDMAYNQLVLARRIKNVLRTIGTSHSIQVRDYHINVLKNRL